MSEEPKAAPIFDDGINRWTVKLTLGLLDRIDEQFGIDLTPDDGNFHQLVGLTINPRRLADVLWVCVEEQAKAKEITRAEFRDRLEADHIASGFEALKEAVIFFIHPSSQQRNATREMLNTLLAQLDEQAISMVAQMRSKESQTLMRETIGREFKEALRAQLARPVSS